MRRDLDVTRVERWNNRRTLWGRTGIMIETTAWRARRRSPAEAQDRSANESKLTIRTHADHEKYTEWSHVAPGETKWRTRAKGATVDWTLTTPEDGMTVALLDWRGRSPRIEDIGLDIKCGVHNRRSMPGRVTSERAAGSAPYINKVHVQRRSIGAAPETARGRKDPKDTGGLEGASDRYKNAAELDEGELAHRGVFVYRVARADSDHRHVGFGAVPRLA